MTFLGRSPSLPVIAVELELGLSCLSEDAIQVTGFCREDAGILSLVLIAQVDGVHCHS
jgi:hypothetical protein